MVKFHLVRAIYVAQQTQHLSTAERSTYIKKHCEPDPRWDAALEFLFKNPPKRTWARIGAGPVARFRSPEGLEWTSSTSAEHRTLARTLYVATMDWIDKKAAIPESKLVLEALSCGGSIVPVWACEVANLIASKHKEPVAFALGLFEKSPAPAKGWLIWLLTSSAEASIALVTAGLRDKSARVRKYACEAAARVGDPEFVSALRAIATHDKIAKVRKEAAQAADLIEHGCHVVETHADRLWIVVAYEASSRRSHLSVSPRAISKLGLRGVAEIARKDPNDPRIAPANG
jgi:hypothetical protein